MAADGSWLMESENELRIVNSKSYFSTMFFCWLLITGHTLLLFESYYSGLRAETKRGIAHGS